MVDDAAPEVEDPLSLVSVFVSFVDVVCVCVRAFLEDIEYFSLKRTLLI